ncbi:MAG TPA: acyltransferase [Bryocella sp.]|nr:acyltransferase [Bryocella sp.]
MPKIETKESTGVPQAESGAAADQGHFEDQGHSEKRKPAARSMLIDAVRGMAISLVALGHTNQGMTHRGWWGASNVGTRLDITIYAFHMPAFFFVSGIFIIASVQKRGPGRFTIERLRTLIYPYVLWSVIDVAAGNALTRYTAQARIEWSHFLPGLIRGYGIWFLPTLFACQVFGMALRKLPGPVILAIALVAYYFMPQTGVNWFDLAVRFFPFVAAGMWMGRGYERLERIPRWAGFVGAVALLAALLAATYKPWTLYQNIVLLSGAIGILMLMMLARSFGRSKLARVFAWIGEASLAIYMAGEYAQGLVRQLMVWAHVITPYPQLILPTLAAILVPSWMYAHRVRLRLGWLFVAPFWEPRPRSPTPVQMTGG